MSAGTNEPEMEEYEVYDLYEAKPAERVEDHYKVATFDAEDYAEEFIEAISSNPVQPGASYYLVIRILTRPHTPHATGDSK